MLKDQNKQEKIEKSKEKAATTNPKKQNPKNKKNSNKPKNVLTTYTVKSGDNLWIIAKKYSGVSAQNLMDFNGIDGNLTVGQKIKIPKY